MPRGRVRPLGFKFFDLIRRHRALHSCAAVREPHNNQNTASFGASPLSATRRFLLAQWRQHVPLLRKALNSLRREAAGVLARPHGAIPMGSFFELIAERPTRAGRLR